MSAARNSGERYPSRRVAWYTVFVLMVCYTLSYCDRQILAFLVGPMKQELHISDTQVGLLQGVAFVLVYTFFWAPHGRARGSSQSA
jgi:sugar phosphate permease